MDETNGTESPAGECLDDRLLSILACPACHEPVEKVESGLHCTACGRKYPIRNGIPVMLLDEAGPPETDGEPASGE